MPQFTADLSEWICNMVLIVCNPCKVCIIFGGEGCKRFICKSNAIYQEEKVIVGNVTARAISSQGEVGIKAGLQADICSETADLTVKREKWVNIRGSTENG